jgi:2-amino-4-hydroxy-6-hydroxymethyldihydropteridine diphosphokinase
VYIGLGSNLGDRAATLAAALRDLAAAGDIRVLRCSSLHETAPVGGPPGQGNYLNAVAELDTELPPQALLTRLLEVERRHGRERRERNGPRTLDLDLLLYREVESQDPELTIPHPRMWEREFVLRPLAELSDLGVRRGAEPVGNPGRRGCV